MHHLHLVKAFDEAARPVGPTPPGSTGHDVHFYRNEAYLKRVVVDFLATGVAAGQPLIVIATEAHRNAFADGLRARRLDVDELLSDREAIWLDARETLACFMEGPCPDRELFMATVGNVFERVLRKRFFLIVRAYGEMVDLLCRDGNTEGAIALEALWNELASRYAHSLLCAYSIDNFLHEAGGRCLRRVCDVHGRTLPLGVDVTGGAAEAG